MLVNDEELSRRLNNPLNLMNRMKENKSRSSERSSAMSLFIKPTEGKTEIARQDNKPAENKTEIIPAPKPATTIPAPPSPSADDLLDDADSKIKLALAHDSALKLLGSAVERLTNEVDNVNIKNLPSVISTASKVVESIRKERIEINKSRKEETVHYHFYCPEPKKLETYEVIEVS